MNLDLKLTLAPRSLRARPRSRRSTGMLKLVTVHVADVVGSTARAERLHPEDVRKLMSDYFQR